MDGGEEAAGHSSGPVIAIIGGGFTGAALALHIAAALPSGRILAFEPRREIGLGLAYSTTDPAHRLNARANRMSLYPDDPAHFYRWIAETGACVDDPEAARPEGRLFPRRAVFGQYVTAQLAPLLRAGRVVHLRMKAENLEWKRGAWTITGADKVPRRADIVILATGHAPQSIPAPFAAVSGHQRFIKDAFLPGALAVIRPRDRVFVAGTGLTMADIVASLDQAGHSGEIIAVSRRGQSPRAHASGDIAPHGGITGADTALALLRGVRQAVGAATAEGQPWQIVFDTLRAQAQPIWLALSEPERRRLIRHARPFWECHRHRLPPPTGAVLRRRLLDGTLAIRAACITAASAAREKISVATRERSGGRVTENAVFDAVILATGPGSFADASGLIAKLLKAGLICPDGTQLGLKSDTPHLFLAGPLTRGSLGEITAVPEIARQAVSIAQHIAQTLFVEAPQSR